MDHVYYTKLGEGRRVAIPAEVCQELGLRPGDPLALKVGDEGLQLLPYEKVVREVQAAFAPYKRPGVSVVDELIQERRKEAAREEREAAERSRAREPKA